MKLSQKVIVVTGGGDGIGRALCAGLAREGATVIVTDIDLEKADQTSQAIENNRDACTALRMDITNQGEIEAALATVYARYGRIDGLINNAGIANVSGLLEITNEEFDQIIQVNLRSVFLCCRAAVGYMMRQGGGSIINMASVAGKTGGGLMGTSVYAASKGGVIAFSKGIARELAPHNIRVNVIAPGSIDTPMTTRGRDVESYEESLRRIPLHRRGRPEDIVGAAVLLLSDWGDFIVGATIDVNGGSHMY